MPDKHLEKLLSASKAELEAKRADIEKQGAATQRANVQAGRDAARRDYGNWRSAIESEIERSIYNTSGSLTTKYDSEHSGRYTWLYAYRKTIFGNYKSHFYYMNGFRDLCKEEVWKDSRIKGYVSELQETLGEKFKVSGEAGGYRTYNDHYAGIEHDDGSTSSMYRTESYEADPSVTVRW